MRYQARKIEKERKRASERERISSSPPHVCLHLFQFTCCRLPRCLSAPSPPRPDPMSSSSTPFSSLFSHFLCPVPSPRPLPSNPSTTRLVGTVQCHVTALEMYRKRRCTDNVTTRLYSPVASPACSILFPRAILSPAHLIRTLPWIDIMQLSDVSRFRKDGRVNVISKSHRLLIHLSFARNFFN